MRETQYLKGKPPAAHSRVTINGSGQVVDELITAWPSDMPGGRPPKKNVRGCISGSDSRVAGYTAQRFAAPSTFAACIRGNA
jgi:hypothetical protein